MYERMLTESKRLQGQINSLQEQIALLPEGKLFCTQNGKYQKWYQYRDSSLNYISKKERHLAEQLAIKKYLSIMLDNLLHQQKATDLYLKYYDHNVKQNDNLINTMSKYTDLVSTHFAQMSQELLTWSTLPYERNNKFPEQLIHKTASGNLVRSKSESLIDMFLYLNKIPFRYECSLQLSGTTIFPDFTILHPKTKEVFYWEHFGLMDDYQYCKSMHSKLQLYTSHGIIPSIQLITTYETKEHPLSPNLVEELVKYYFL